MHIIGKSKQQDETRFILPVLLCSVLINTAYSTGAQSVQIEVRITAMGWEGALSSVVASRAFENY